MQEEFSKISAWIANGTVDTIDEKEHVVFYIDGDCEKRIFIKEIYESILEGNRDSYLHMYGKTGSKGWDLDIYYNLIDNENYIKFRLSKKCPEYKSWSHPGSRLFVNKATRVYAVFVGGIGMNTMISAKNCLETLFPKSKHVIKCKKA